ncbi:MAG: hypothetical protein M3R38_12745 [Actinomycetota bacterium]|nr:hypothetical protein [Actinomycetota bacterium]
MEEADYSRADLAAHRWRLEAEILSLAKQAEAKFGLDPMLLDRLQDAEREQDREAFWLAAMEATVATLEAREERGY